MSDQSHVEINTATWKFPNRAPRAVHDAASRPAYPVSDSETSRWVHVVYPVWQVGTGVHGVHGWVPVCMVYKG